MWKPVPIIKSDIQVGKRYIEVTVCFDGRIILEKHTFLEKPVLKRDGWWVRTHRRQEWCNKTDDFLMNFAHLGDMGIVRTRFDNEHRTFKSTRATERYLKKFVQKSGGVKKYVSYLKFIGNKNPQEQVTKNYEDFFFSRFFEVRVLRGTF